MSTSRPSLPESQSLRQRVGGRFRCEVCGQALAEAIALSAPRCPKCKPLTAAVEGADYVSAGHGCLKHSPTCKD